MPLLKDVQRNLSVAEMVLKMEGRYATVTTSGNVSGIHDMVMVDRSIASISQERVRPFLIEDLAMRKG